MDAAKKYLKTFGQLALAMFAYSFGSYLSTTYCGASKVLNVVFMVLIYAAIYGAIVGIHHLFHRH